MGLVNRILAACASGALVGCAASADAPAQPNAAPPGLRRSACWFHPPDATRHWVDAHTFTNRLQDWQLRDQHLVCLERRASAPLRTAMRMSSSLARDGEVVLEAGIGAADGRPWPSVRSGTPVTVGEAEPVTHETPFRGVLLGAGGEHVDWRLSAMVHHRPAVDGGLLAVVDAHGSVALFDNGVPASAGGSWSLGGPLRDGELPRLAWSPAERPVDPSIHVELRVSVGAADAEGLCTLAVDSFTRDTGDPDRLLAHLEHRVERARLDGAFGLVSHLGPPGTDEGWTFDVLVAQGDGVVGHPERTFGPVIATHFTTGDHGLVLNAQLAPMEAASMRVALLYERDPSDPEFWIERARAPVDTDSWTARFQLPDWDTSRASEYAVDVRGGGVRGESPLFTGTIPAEPSADEPFVIASLNCQKIYTGGLQWNHDGLWFPHAETARDVAAHEPDLLFFAGDQIYEGDLDPVDARDEDTLILDYLYKYMRHCWSFGELTRNVPSIVIPDDHDVYHGNLWGAGGRAAVADKARGLSAQDSGGYKHGPRFVNVVHRTQTGSLPDPVDPAPVEQGISVYFTELEYGGVSFAVLADRQWKSSASVLVPDGQVVNGWFQAEGFDPRDADVPGAVLLGERQLAFLDRWAADWSDGTWMKVALSQTPFVNVATIPETAAGGGVLPSLTVPAPDAYPEGYKFAADTDSGGWPQSGRDAAVRALRKGFAVHLAGDQHLGSLVEYGVDAHRDGGFAFTAPAVANTWPRRWWPPIHGADPEPGAPHYTGDFEDGFGNLMTVWAVANPVQSGREPRNLFDRMPGYGIVRLHPDTRAIDLECWPRDVDPTADDAWQYAGWPRRIAQLDNHGAPVGHLAPVRVPGNATPVVQLVDERSGETVYTLRAPRDGFRPPVYGEGPFTLGFGEPGTDAWWRVTGLTATGDEADAITPPR